MADRGDVTAFQVIVLMLAMQDELSDARDELRRLAKAQQEAEQVGDRANSIKLQQGLWHLSGRVDAWAAAVSLVRRTYEEALHGVDAHSRRPGSKAHQSL